MFTLVKLNFHLISPIEYSLYLLLILLTFIVPLPVSLLILVIISFGYMPFLYHGLNKIDYFLHSLPINKVQLVISRYIWIIALTMTTFLSQFIIMNLFNVFHFPIEYVYSLYDLFIILLIIQICSLISLPILFVLKNQFAIFLAIYSPYFIGVSVFSNYIQSKTGEATIFSPEAILQLKQLVTTGQFLLLCSSVIILSIFSCQLSIQFVREKDVL